MTMAEQILKAVLINKYFYEPSRFKALSDITFGIERGKFVSVVGKSGCAKSTLLYILSTMDSDFEGELFLDNELLNNKTDRELSRIRNEKIGFIFQFHYLIEEFNVINNIMLPALKLGKLSRPEIESQAMHYLNLLGIAGQALKHTNQLSGGEKQRVAIARALINNPLIIMADEPTGNLDKKNSEMVFGLFKELSVEMRQTILVVTHDKDFARQTDQTIEMQDGRIIST